MKNKDGDVKEHWQLEKYYNFSDVMLWFLYKRYLGKAKLIPYTQIPTSPKISRNHNGTSITDVQKGFS